MSKDGGKLRCRITQVPLYFYIRFINLFALEMIDEQVKHSDLSFSGSSVCVIR